MNTKASMFFVGGALVLTLLSACDAAFGFDARDVAAVNEATETRKPEVLSVGSLRGRLRGTRALSIAGKLGLKFEIDNLVEKFRVAHVNGGEVSALRQPFDSLITRI